MCCYLWNYQRWWDYARRDDLFAFAKKHNLKMITIKDLINYRRKEDILVTKEAEQNFQLSLEILEWLDLRKKNLNYAM